MITPWTIYWLSRLDYFSGSFCALFLLSAALVIVAGIVWLIAKADEAENIMIVASRWFKRSLVSFFISLLVYNLTPTTKEMAAILIIPAIANNQQVQDIGKEFGDLAKQWLEELKPKKGNTK